jgi:hypothetical protein
VTANPSPVEWIGLTLDCADDESPQGQLREFYAGALGGEIFNGGVRARGLLLMFRPVDGYQPPTWPESGVPMQLHFEWVVPDIDAAIEHMTSCGARLAEWQDDTDPDIRVMLDPAGHPFCLIAAHSVGEFKNEARYQTRETDPAR